MEKRVSIVLVRVAKTLNSWLTLRRGSLFRFATLLGSAVLTMLASTPSECSASVYWATGNDGSSLINFDTATAATTVVGNFPTGAYGLAFAPDGSAYTLQSSGATLAKINLSNGALTTIGGPGGFFGYALDFANDGTLYAVNQSDQIYKINTITGAFTFERNMSNLSLQIMDITFDPSGNLYGVGSDSRVYKIDLATGTTTLAYTTVLSSLMGIAADGAGNLIATSYANPSQFERINISSGTSVIVGTIGGGTSFDHGGDIMLAAVPEPSTFLMTALGGLSMLGVARRMRK